MKSVAIDPPGCGCTECITGEYVPLHEATPAQIADMLAGRVADNTNSSTEFTVIIRVAAESDGLTWDLDPAMLGIAITQRTRP